MADGGLKFLLVSNIINAIIGWIFPWFIIHGIAAIILNGKLNDETLGAFHEENETNGCCLVVASIFSFIWSVLWAIACFLMFWWIIPIFFGIIAVFSAIATLRLMLSKK